MARNGQYSVEGKPRGFYIILDTDHDTQELELQVCKTLGLTVENMRVSLGERRNYEPRKMIGPMAKETANARRVQINQNVSHMRQQKN